MAMMWRIIAVTVLAVFGAGCAGPPPSRSQLSDLLRQNLIHLLDKNFEHLPPGIKQKDVVFLGEVHKIGELHEAAARLTVYLAADRPVVYARETVYGLHPFFEAASMGSPNNLQPVQIPRQILEFNANQSPDRKILMTALDVEHTIRNNKKDTVCFLQELASRSASTTVREALEKEIPRLTETKTFDQVDAYLLDLEKIFIPNLSTFSAEDREEIRFSMNLLQASNQIKRNDRLPNVQENWKALNRAGNLRYKYFKKTIERAWQKAQKNNAILLCHVGNAHISLVRDCETRYFARDYPVTKGKVAAIQMIPLYEDGKKKESDIKEESCDIDSIVRELMKENEYCYLPLGQLQKSTKMSLKGSRYYCAGRPECDGLLFVKTRTNSK